MKKTSSNLLNWAAFAIILIFLAGNLYLIKKNRNTNTEDLIIPEFSNIESIEIAKKDRNFKLINQDNSWIIEENEKKYEGDNEKINNIVTKINGLQIAKRVSVNKDNQETIYGFNVEDTITITIKADNQKKQKYNLGKTSSGKTYMHIEDNRTFQASENLRADFDREPNYFRNKKVVEFDKNEITKIYIQDNQENLGFEFNKNAENWLNINSEEVKIEGINSYLNTLNNLIASELIDNADLSEYNLTEKNYSTVIAIKKDEAKDMLYLSEANEKYYLQKNDQIETIYEISKYQYDQLRGEVFKSAE